MAVATLLGYAILIPRVSVVISDPPNPSDPLSSSVTITNTGYLPLERVKLSYVLGHLIFINEKGFPVTIEGGSEIEPGTDMSKLTILHWEPWGAPDLGIDGSYEVALNDGTKNLHRDNVVDVQMGLMVDYKLPILPIHKRKLFPFFAKRQGENIYWYAGYEHPKPN